MKTFENIANRTGGFALVLLAFLYWVLEIKHWHGPWTMPILVFGMNAMQS